MTEVVTIELPQLGDPTRADRVPGAGEWDDAAPAGVPVER